MMQYKGWEGFVPGKWCNDEVDVRDFIQHNYTPYEGDGKFLAPATEATKKLWDIVCDLSKKEREAGGVLNADTKIVSTLTSHGAGYLDKDLEKIVGLQTDEPFKRSLQPFGGIRMSEGALEMYGYKLDEGVKEIFTKYRKTHNEGVFDVYTPEMRAARSAHILTGLPDAYGRGRIVGDYRRVALYGVDYLIRKKEEDKLAMNGDMTPEKVRNREEIADQIKALAALKEMAAIYGCDISKPAETAQQAIQALYFGYLAAVKDQNGAAMSIGRNTTFLDIYIERDLAKGLITETEAQEFIDHVNKCGGFCVSCHPFRNNNRGLEDNLRNVKGLHGVDVLNGSTSLEANRTALRYCRELGLQAIGASDAHVEMQIAKYVTWLPEKVSTLPDFIAQLHACQPKPAMWNGSSYDVLDNF